MTYEIEYERWKKDIDIWQKLTNVPAEKQALAVHLTLTGKAREVSSEIDTVKLASAEGMKVLLEKLDGVFMLDKNRQAFMAYSDFERFKRPAEMSIPEYLIEFDRKYYKFKRHGMELPDQVLAFRLLKSCDISDIHFQLAMSTTATITFEEMKKTLQRMFGDGIMDHDLSGNSQREGVKWEPSLVKNEPILQASRYQSDNYSRGFRPRYGNRWSGTRGRWQRGHGGGSRCFRCGSADHWIRNCPVRGDTYDRGEETDVTGHKEVQLTLMADGCDKREKLLAESMGAIVLDSGCATTVCGEDWLQIYVDTLSTCDADMITRKGSDISFRFGDGKQVVSKGNVHIPCYIHGVKVMISTEVVDCRIPLLMSRSAMKRGGMILNFGKDTMRMFGKESRLQVTSTGHYVFPIIKAPSKKSVEVVLFAGQTEGIPSKVWKLHRQFAHPTANKLMKLVEEAGLLNNEWKQEIQKVSDKCDICRKFKKTPPRPVVGFPVGKVFNEAVGMDLKVWGNCYFIVMVDLATRYCVASVIANKKPETIIKEVITQWISRFGAPQKVLTDNGREFNNVDFQSMGENYNVKVMCTAAESPWSNGICERLNAVLGDNVTKIMADTECDVSTALAWAVSTRNALQNNNGFSPNQLVYGFNPTLPSVMCNNIPALENKTTSEVVANNLNAMRAAREAFIKNESNERIRRALLHNVRGNNMEDLQNGDQVYYKRNNENQWRGPGIVIGRDGKQVLVKQGGTYVRAHTCRLQVVPETSLQMQKPGDQDSSRRDIGDNPAVTRKKEDVTEVRGEVEEDTESEEEEHDTEARSEEDLTVRQMPKSGDRLEGFLTESGEKVNITILSRAGKATGKYKSCFNIRNESDNTVGWLDLNRDLYNWQVVKDDEEVLVACSGEECLEEKRKEIRNWIDNEVFEEVEDQGQKSISTRWIITQKVKAGATVLKARLVARGFEEELCDVPVDSPTCSKEAFRVALSITAGYNWEPHSMDVKFAFLQGHPITREVYLRPPVEFNKGLLWKAKKTVYGLNDAARAWYERVKKELTTLGMSVCGLEPALFYWHQKGELQGIVCTHVDDFFWSGTECFKTNVIDGLERLFLIGSEEHKCFRYLGITIKQEQDGIMVNQDSYIKHGIQEVDIAKRYESRKSDEVSVKDKTNYRSVVGQINWIATQTRPDVAYDVCELSSAFGHTCVGDVIKANKVVKKVKDNPVSLWFGKVKLDECMLICYSDAAFGNLNDNGSQGGHIIFLKDREGNSCPIVWRSRRVRRVVKSTLAAETLSLLDAAENGMYLAVLMKTILGNQYDIPMICLVDNKSLVESLKSTKLVEDRSLRINMAVLRDMMTRGDIQNVEWVETAKQLADCLTKKGASPVLLMKQLGRPERK